MAYGKGAGRMEEHLELLQYIIYIFNTVFFCAGSAIFAVAMWIRFSEDMGDYVLGLGMYHYWSGPVVIMTGAALIMLSSFLACCGAAVFALGLWIRFDKDMDEYVNSLGMYHYWTSTTIIMTGATLVMITAFLGCCGAFCRNLFLIISYMVMTVITFLLLLGGSAYVLDNGLEDTRIYPWIQEKMRQLIYRYQWDMAARRSVDIIQEYVGCCGGYSADDFTSIHLPIPDTCRNQVTGNQYGDSCAEIFSQYLEVRTGWISGLALSLCFFQCFAMIFAICIWQAIREMEASK